MRRRRRRRTFKRMLRESRLVKRLATWLGYVDDDVLFRAESEAKHWRVVARRYSEEYVELAKEFGIPMVDEDAIYK